MSRIITVKGVGKVSMRPNYVVLSMKLDAKDMDYAKAMEMGSTQFTQLNEGFKSMGFEKDAVKTTNFNVYADYENVRDEKDEYHRVFKGFICSHQVKISFDFHMGKIAQALEILVKCHAYPELNIEFTVKNPIAIQEELLREATFNAKKKAKLLCEASGVRMGQLLTIDYNWKDIRPYSNTRYSVGEDTMLQVAPRMAAIAMNIEPDDIEVNDSATFVWEIE